MGKDEKTFRFNLKQNHLCFCATLAGNQMKSTTAASNPVCPLGGEVLPNTYFTKSVILIDSFHFHSSHLFIYF